MSAQPESSSIPLSVLDSKRAAKNSLPLPQSVPSSSPPPEIKVPAVPAKKTFLMKAEEDLAKCVLLDNKSWFSSNNRTRVLTLLRETLISAQAAEIDTHLCTVYVSIDRLIKGLFWEDDLKAVFVNTLRELRNNQLHRQRGVIQDLVEKVSVLQGTIEDQKQEIESHVQTIESLKADVKDALVAAAIAHKDVQDLLASAKADREARQRPPAPPLETTTGHDPRLFGGGQP